MKIARFKAVISPLDYFRFLSEEDLEKHPSIYGPTQYTRVSEWIEVEFSPREDLIQERLAALDQAETDVRQRHAADLARISTERAQLRKSNGVLA